jgi:thiamine-monophosphate kinase
VALGIGDDCAILRPRAGQEVLVTTDFTLEGRHFRRDTHSAESVGHRTLARGLSDLAAMGAKPLAGFLSLALSKEMVATRAGRRWLDGYLAGLHALAERTGVELAGGDTAESPTEHLLADIVLVGTAPRGRALRRSGARAGDTLYVTGALGGAAAELEALFAGRGRRARMGPQLFPEPRLGVGQALLRQRIATACMDLSDGLSTDLTHLCAASGVRAEIFEADLPVHPLAQARANALELVLNGGEDYELLFSVAAGTRVPRRLAGSVVTRIGRLVAKDESRTAITLADRDGRMRAVAAGGWQHLV